MIFPGILLGNPPWILSETVGRQHEREEIPLKIHSLIPQKILAQIPAEESRSLSSSDSALFKLSSNELFSAFASPSGSLSRMLCEVFLLIKIFSVVSRKPLWEIFRLTYLGSFPANCSREPST